MGGGGGGGREGGREGLTRDSERVCVCVCGGGLTSDSEWGGVQKTFFLSDSL